VFAIGIGHRIGGVVGGFVPMVTVVETGDAAGAWPFSNISVLQ
jgi:hypothetical protein